MKILSRMGFITDDFAKISGNQGQNRGWMTNGEAVAAGDFFDKRTHQVRADHHVCSGEDSSKNNQFSSGQSCINACCDEYIREPVQHVSGQEDGFPFSETCK